MPEKFLLDQIQNGQFEAIVNFNMHHTRKTVSQTARPLP